MKASGGNSEGIEGTQCSAGGDIEGHGKNSGHSKTSGRRDQQLDECRGTVSARRAIRCQNYCPNTVYFRSFNGRYSSFLPSFVSLFFYVPVAVKYDFLMSCFQLPPMCFKVKVRN
jgi:hypothetical protein